MDYWKSAQPRTPVRPMAERPIWPCHSVYRETARVERTISLFDCLTAPATISNMDVSIYISLTARSQDRIGLHLRIYSSRPMSAGDGGCQPGTVKVPSPAGTGRPAVIHMLGRDGRLWRRPVRPGKISDGTVENTGRSIERQFIFSHRETPHSPNPLFVNSDTVDHRHPPFGHTKPRNVFKMLFRYV
jgi:hypothetical protein